VTSSECTVIRNLIWDVDGTLFDTYPAIVQTFLESLVSFEVAVSADEVDALARVGLSHCARELADRFGLEEERLGERFGGLYSALPKQAQPPFEGAREVCEAVISRGGVNAIVTHRGRESTEALLAVHGLTHLFSGTIGGDEGFPKKPAPQALVAMLARCYLDPGQTATVGDRESDILAARAA
jgi:phosphoglycolate phosphatase-like HAD superfamily hydrolase